MFYILPNYIVVSCGLALTNNHLRQFQCAKDHGILSTIGHLCYRSLA